LIQVTTIEKFLPFHAACAQGHIEILKLLVNFKNSFEKEQQTYDKVYSDASNQKYLSPFDLNALDVNEQSGLYAAVQGNRNVICEFLLNLKLKKLTDKDISKHEEAVRKQNSKIPSESSSLFNLSSILSPNTQSVQPSSSISFFSQLKNVLLDSSPKPQDSFVINYTKSSPFQDHHKETLFDHEHIAEEESDMSTGTDTAELSSNATVYFNPININNYSKFGTTCLHEAVKNRNFPLVQLLVAKGANVNLPIYEPLAQLSTVEQTPSNLSTSGGGGGGATPTVISPAPKIVSNALCEALKSQDEQTFAFLVSLFKFDEESMRLVLKLCKECLASQTGMSKFARKAVPYLIKLKIVNDTEHKVNLKNKLSSKLLAIYQNSGSSDESSANHTIDSGLVLNWSGLDPKLDRMYESWLLNATKYFKFPVRQADTTQTGGTATPLATPQTEEINMNSFMQASIREETNLLVNLKKLHLHTITRCDLSANQLESLPFALFQIETLKYLKLSGNGLRRLPAGKSKELDDVNILLINNENLYWTCNQLEEIELDNNQLVELPAQLFLIKSLKHVNVSNNTLEALPIEMWQAPSLFDLNASFNRLTHLPIVNCDYFFYKENMSKNQRSRAYTSPTMTSGSSSQVASSGGRTTRRDEARTRTRTVQDHPLNGSGNNKPVKSMPNSRSMNLISAHKEKPVFKANIWHMHSVNTSGKFYKVYFLAFAYKKKKTTTYKTKTF
jgi:Leucine-rich repeat (LRR) protein